MHKEDLLRLLDRPIAFQPAFVSITGSLAAALMLSQAMYWSKRSSTGDGWFYKTQGAWTDETGITRYEQATARKGLKSAGLLEEKLRGAPAKMYYRVNLNALYEALLGARKTMTLDEVLSIYASQLNSLSKGGYMRAIKAGVEAEHVDYSEVITEHGLVCHICTRAITVGPGQAPDSLTFDHVIPVVKNGGHIKSNIRPAHFRCNLIKGGLACLSKADQFAKAKQTGLLKHSEQDVQSEATSICTETTTKNTTRPRFALPEWVPVDNWKGFEEMRQRARKPLTDRARKMIVNELSKLKTEGHDPAAVLDQSVRHSWADVYPIKVNGDAAPGQQKPSEWWRTWPGIEAKAKELGVSKDEREAFPHFKARVFKAAGTGPWEHQR